MFECWPQYGRDSAPTRRVERSAELSLDLPHVAGEESVEEEVGTEREDREEVEQGQQHLGLSLPHTGEDERERVDQTEGEAGRTIEEDQQADQPHSHLPPVLQLVSGKIKLMLFAIQ